MLLDINHHTFPPVVTTKGARVQVHHPQEEPDVEDSGINVMPNAATSLAIEQVTPKRPPPQPLTKNRLTPPPSRQLPTTQCAHNRNHQVRQTSETRCTGKELERSSVYRKWTKFSSRKNMRTGKAEKHAIAYFTSFNLV